MYMAQHGMLSERVGSMHAHKHYVCTSLVQNAVCRCCALCRSVKKGLCKVTGEKTDVHESQTTPTRKHKYEEVRWSLSHSSLAVRCGVSQLFALPLLAFRSYSYHCTVHHNTCTRALAWHGLIWHASMGTCKISVSREWDGHGRCTCSRRPH